MHDQSVINGMQQHETEEMFIQRAHELSMNLLANATIEGHPHVMFAQHVMEVVFLVSRVYQLPEVLAACWLNDLVKTQRLSYEETAKSFGFTTSALIRTLVEGHEDPDAHLEALKANTPALTIMAAKILSTVRYSAVTNWVEARANVNLLRKYHLTGNLNPLIGRVVEVTIQEMANYLDNIIGDLPIDTPRISTGHPSTLGVYRMLVTQHWGPTCPACIALTALIEKHGPFHQVTKNEQEMLDLLQRLNSGESISIEI